jgi:hypothetical protein
LAGWTALLAAAGAAPSHGAAAGEERDMTPPTMVSTTDWQIRRVAGDMDVASEYRDGEWRCGRSRIESPLPEGYPAPTPPGAIELKRYPTVRRAEISSNGSPDRGQWSGFWPLFQHIKSRDIAMTSPVEMDYRDWSADDERPQGRWTMSFLYRTADLGPTGLAGDVLVVDAAPRTVISIGLRGPYGTRTIGRGLDELHAWLAGQDEWVIDGDPRAFYYNGPYIRDGLKWSEAQIPVRRASEGATDTSATADATRGAAADRPEGTPPPRPAGT